MVHDSSAAPGVTGCPVVGSVGCLILRYLGFYTNSEQQVSFPEVKPGAFVFEVRRLYSKCVRKLIVIAN